MSEVTEFVVGQKYTNDQIRFALNVVNLKGIRPSLDDTGALRRIAIMSALPKARAKLNENPYRDRIEGDTLVFTAAGREGDQQLHRENKRVLEQYQSPVPFFGFVNHGRQTYEFVGLLELLRHYQEQQVDRTKTLRGVWVFEFRIHKNPAVVPIAHARRLMENILANSPERCAAVEGERQIVAGYYEPKQADAITDVEEVRVQLLGLNPFRFEHLVKAVMQKNGFREVEVTKATGDGGIDLNAVVDDFYPFFNGTVVQGQAKRWRHAVGSVEINNFRGAMNSNAKGVFITTGSYTRAAVENAYSAGKQAVSLIDGLRFAALVRSSGIQPSSFE
jgi:hypothetical protein